MDVPPDNTFYAYVRCLSCRGIVGGYPCGGPGEPCPGAYFRPGNNVTRGQTSKIVALSGGLRRPGAEQPADVRGCAAGQHLLAVGRAAGRARGIIGGYPCGGPFEPCVAAANRPYFRPNNDVTRGQLTKIVAARPGTPRRRPGRPSRMCRRAAPSTCGSSGWRAGGSSAGIPAAARANRASPPGNRPYFRPNNNATRGQMAKIAAQPSSPTAIRRGRRPRLPQLTAPARRPHRPLRRLFVQAGALSPARIRD